MLAHELRAVADDIGAVTDARFTTDTSAGTRSARGFARVPITKRAAAFATARLNKSPLASQTVVTTPRAVRAAVAMEQVPLP